MLTKLQPADPEGDESVILRAGTGHPLERAALVSPIRCSPQTLELAIETEAIVLVDIGLISAYNS